MTSAQTSSLNRLPTSSMPIDLESNSVHILQELFMLYHLGVAHQSQNNIRVALHHLDQQPSPKRHHQETYSVFEIPHQRTSSICWSCSIYHRGHLHLVSYSMSVLHRAASIGAINQSHQTSSSRRRRINIILFYIKQQHWTSRTSVFTSA